MCKKVDWFSNGTRLLRWCLVFCCALSGLVMLQPAAAASLADSQHSHFSTVLQQQRRYQVSLPERYQSSARRYAVLYLIDADFQFEHVAATVRQLARAGRIAPLIVVGVATNGSSDYQHKTSWLTPDLPGSGGAAAMLQYLQTELQPVINTKYRTSGNQALLGYSLGGLLSLQALLQGDGTYSAFYALSPSVWLDNQSIIGRFQRTALTTLPASRLFISLANEEGMGVQELRRQLQQQAPAKLHWQFAHFPAETHYSMALPALTAALQWDFAGHFVDFAQLLKFSDHTKLLDYFAARRQHWAGYQYDWLQAYTIAKYLWVSNQWPQAEQLLQQTEQRLPGSSNELRVQLAKVLLKKQQAKLALQLLQQVPQAEYHDWHKQMADAYAALQQPKLARQYQQQAEALVISQQLEPWEYQELEPGTYR